MSVASGEELCEDSNVSKDSLGTNVIEDIDIIEEEPSDNVGVVSSNLDVQPPADEPNKPTARPPWKPSRVVPTTLWRNFGNPPQPKTVPSMYKRRNSSPVKGDFFGYEPSTTPRLSIYGVIARPPKTSLCFYCGEGNNFNYTVVAPLLSMGWKRIEDRRSYEFRLKWVQCKSRIDFDSFREGDQLVNHIPNINLLTTKLGLLGTLREYERQLDRVGRRVGGLSMDQFFPETYKLNVKAEREAFIEQFQENEMWICKPSGLNQGKGIYIVSSLDEFNRRMASHASGQRFSRSLERIVQRYVDKPLLLNGKKFDIRSYMLIAGTAPYMVYCRDGYCRLCIREYTQNDTSDMTVHLNNQYIQKKDPSYAEFKEDTVWSMEQLNDYVNEHHGEVKEKDWVLNYVSRRMFAIMLHVFNAVRNKLDVRLGYFELLGFDFLIDENFKIYIIEININPALSTNCAVLDAVIPPVVREGIELSLEIWEKSRCGISLSSLEKQGDWKLLHSGARQHRRVSCV